MSLAGNVKKENLNMACGLFLIVFDGNPLPPPFRIANMELRTTAKEKLGEGEGEGAIKTVRTLDMKKTHILLL
jgi:hypothetical protein